MMKFCWSALLLSFQAKDHAMTLVEKSGQIYINGFALLKINSLNSVLCNYYYMYCYYIIVIGKMLK